MADNFSDANLTIRNGKAQLGGQVFPLQMVRSVSIETGSIGGGIVCLVIAVFCLVVGRIDYMDGPRAMGAWKGLLPVGGLFLLIAIFNIWAIKAHKTLRVYLHSGGVVQLSSKNRGYLEKLAQAIQSAAMG